MGPKGYTYSLFGAVVSFLMEISLSDEMAESAEGLLCCSCRLGRGTSYHLIASRSSSFFAIILFNSASIVRDCPASLHLPYARLM